MGVDPVRVFGFATFNCYSTENGVTSDEAEATRDCVCGVPLLPPMHL